MLSSPWSGAWSAHLRSSSHISAHYDAGPSQISDNITPGPDDLSQQEAPLVKLTLPWINSLRERDEVLQCAGNKCGGGPGNGGAKLLMSSPCNLSRTSGAPVVRRKYIFPPQILLSISLYVHMYKIYHCIIRVVSGMLSNVQCPSIYN